MNKSRTLHQALSDYIPESAIEPVENWFNHHFVVLSVTRNRLTKLGDFRGSLNDKASYISVNHNLNRYSFLITLLHEMAHADVHFTYKRLVKPHGKAWKLAYQRLATPFTTNGTFPEKLNHAFIKYLLNPRASSMSFMPLAQALREYDNNSDDIIVSMLAPETLFAIHDGRVFKMVEKLRKRYRCYCLDNKKTYLFSPLAIIKPLEDQQKRTDD